MGGKFLALFLASVLLILDFEKKHVSLARGREAAGLVPIGCFHYEATGELPGLFLCDCLLEGELVRALEFGKELVEKTTVRHGVAHAHSFELVILRTRKLVLGGAKLICGSTEMRIKRTALSLAPVQCLPESVVHSVPSRVL